LRIESRGGNLIAMPEERKKIELNIGTMASIVAIVLGAIALYGVFTSHTAKSVTDQLQDDSAYARSTRAISWIEQNGWRLTHHKDSTLK